MVSFCTRKKAKTQREILRYAKFLHAIAIIGNSSPQNGSKMGMGTSGKQRKMHKPLAQNQPSVGIKMPAILKESE